MNRYHLEVIAAGQTHRDNVLADQLEIRDGAYVFYSIVKEVERGYVPLGASCVSMVKKIVASYPVGRTIISSVEYGQE